MTELMGPTIKAVCRSSEVPRNEIRQFSAGGMEVLVINAGGEFHCLESKCPHAGAPLVKGKLNGGELECPWHDASFRIGDGSVVHGPPKKPLQVFDCFTREGWLYADIRPLVAPSGSPVTQDGRSPHSK